MGINGEIAKIFLELAFLYEMKNDRFRARAYERGGMELENLAEDAEDIYKRSGLEGLEDLPGIGRGMAEKIEEYANTGHIKEYDDMKTPILDDEGEETGEYMDNVKLITEFLLPLTKEGFIPPQAVKTIIERKKIRL